MHRLPTRALHLVVALLASLPACAGPEPTPTPGALDAAVADPIDGGPGASCEAWRPGGRIAIASPLDHGAVGDGVADDRRALEDAIAALPPAGGIVYLPPGRIFRKDDVLVVDRAHVKLWAPDRQATILSATGGVRRRSGTICRGVAGCGFFGLRLTSDAVERFDALEDNQLSTDQATDVEIEGNEIDGSPAAGIFLYGASRRLWIAGNYVHHTYADHIHHTAATRSSWVWGNWFFNEAPSEGDDGIACVTYCPTCPRCGDMEWWGNVHLGAGHGRGYAVIGGDHIAIHHNWAIRTAGAGLIVASEPSYDSASSHAIALRENWLVENAHRIGHPAMLVSGLNPDADPISDVVFERNVVVDPVHGAYRVEGATDGVENLAMSSEADALPTPTPTIADARPFPTAILRTRDVSFVDAGERAGLYRIHVRVAPGSEAGSEAGGEAGGDGLPGFEERYEYVVRGAPAAVEAWVAARAAEGDCPVETREVGGQAVAVALVLTAAPRALAEGLAAVSFEELRAGDDDGTLSWLWERLEPTPE